MNSFRRNRFFELYAVLMITAVIVLVQMTSGKTERFLAETVTEETGVGLAQEETDIGIAQEEAGYALPEEETDMDLPEAEPDIVFLEAWEEADYALPEEETGMDLLEAETDIVLQEVEEETDMDLLKDGGEDGILEDLIFSEEGTEELGTAFADPSDTLIILPMDREPNSSTYLQYNQVYPYEGCLCPKYQQSEFAGRMNGSNITATKMNSTIKGIEWQKNTASSGPAVWKTDTSGRFSTGQWHCILKLSLTADMKSKIYPDPSDPYCSRILLEGLPENLKWKGDGNSSGNMTFTSELFTVEEREYHFDIPLKGELPEFVVGEEAKVPAMTPVSPVDLQEKGITVEDAYWYRDDSQDTQNWENIPRMKPGDVFEAGTYYLAVRVSCGNPAYRLDDIWTSVKLNDYSISNRAKFLSDGSLLVSERHIVERLGIQDGIVYYVLDAKAKTAAAVDTYPEQLPKDVVIPSTVSFYGGPYTVTALHQTFRYSEIRSVRIPKTVVSLGEPDDDSTDPGVFYECSSLESVIFAPGSTLENLVRSCFDCCNKLKEVVLPTSIKKIDSSAFTFCRNLESIHIPASVQQIDMYAFSYCDKLKQVTFAEDSKLSTIDIFAFLDCPALEEIVLPAAVEKIKGYAFEKCKALAKVHFPQGSRIKEIGEDAFGAGTDSFPILLEYVEGDASAKTAIDQYIAWAKGKGWTYITTNPLANIGAGTASSIGAQVYTGKKLTPKIKVQYKGKTLTEGTDYSLRFDNNVNVGTCTITIRGTGAYAGTLKKTFEIIPKGTSISKITKGKKKATVKWKTQKVQTDGYEIQYSLKKKFSSGVKTKKVSGHKKKSLVIKKLKSGKKYYMRIRTWKKVGGKKYYSAWSKAKSVKVK